MSHQSFKDVNLGPVPIVDDLLDPGQHINPGSRPLLVGGMAGQRDISSKVSYLLLAKTVLAPDGINHSPNPTIADP